MMERAKEADELHHHDQRAGCRLGKGEAIEHLSGREPVECLDGLLRYIGEHGVCAAEGHHRGLAEEDAFACEHAVASEFGYHGHHRQPPDHEPDERATERGTEGWACVYEMPLAKQPIDQV